jgi:tetratricopeptide (TPR) repeat protein
MKASLYLTLGLILIIPFEVFAQSMRVFGGNQYARECQLNVEMANNLGSGSRAFIEPCDFVLRNIQELTPRDRAATLNNRAVLKYLIQDFEGAFDDFDVAAQMMPDSPIVIANRGNAFYYTGQLALALEDYSDALELGISRPHAVHSNMGIVYEEMGNLQEAEFQYQRALELSPGWEKAEMLLENVQRRLQESRQPDTSPN